jgi:O-antigen ligase
LFEFIARNKVLLLVFAIWYAVGSVSPIAFFGLGFLSIVLFWRRALFFEIFLGFIFILLLSDNLRYTTDFAKTFKNLYIVLLSAIAILERRRFGIDLDVLRYFIPFLMVAVVSLAYSPQMFTSFQKTLSYALILFAAPQFLIFSFKERGPVVVKDIIYLGVFMILVGFLIRFIDPGWVISHGGRFRGLFGNPNGMGIFIILLFALTLIARDYFKALITKSDMRWIFITILGALVLSGSRSALIAVVLFYLFSRFYKFSPFLGFILFIAVSVGAEILSQNLVPIVQALGLSDYFRVETLEDASGRYIAWEFAWDAIQDNFWLGRGFSFDEWLMRENQDFLNDLGHQGGVHNTYLIIWLNTGIIGLLLFLRGYVVLAIKGAKNSAMAFPLFWMVLFSIMLEPWLAASLNPFTILFLIGLVILTNPLFQPYHRGELKSDEIIDEKTVLA